MKNINISALLAVLFIISSCSPKTSGFKSNLSNSKADQIISKSIQAHGGIAYEKETIQFIFRKNNYIFSHPDGGYLYQSTKTSKDGSEIIDVLDNGVFTRKINGSEKSLSDKDIRRFSDGLNSVIYFASLPYKLSDKAVSKKYFDEVTIKGKKYHELEITFSEEDGGTDHDDVFHYWIAHDDYTIDYLAYSYQVNGGGVRFRSAFNPSVVAGIRFQDYINFKAPVGTPLENLPELYESGKLKELSRIITESITQL
jgi:hypothetical protein